MHGHVLEPDNELLHHADGQRGHLHDIGGDFLGAFHEAGVGDDFVDEVDSEGFVGVEGAVGEEDAHGVGVGDLAGEVGGTGAVSDPSLAEEGELEAGVFLAGDADVGGGEHHVEPGSSGPAVDGGDDGFPDLGVVVAEAAVDAELGAVDGAGRGPEDVLGADPFLFLGGNPGRSVQVVSGAEMAIASAGENDGTDIGIVPGFSPGIGQAVGGFLVEDVGLFRIVDGDVGDLFPLFVQDFHGCSSWGQAPDFIAVLNSKMFPLAMEGIVCFRGALGDESPKPPGYGGWRCLDGLTVGWRRRYVAGVLEFLECVRFRGTTG